MPKNKKKDYETSMTDFDKFYDYDYDELISIGIIWVFSKHDDYYDMGFNVKVSTIVKVPGIDDAIDFAITLINEPEIKKTYGIPLEAKLRYNGVDYAYLFFEKHNIRIEYFE